jgi:hypothetical protein
MADALTTPTTPAAPAAPAAPTTPAAPAPWYDGLKLPDAIKRDSALAKYASTEDAVKGLVETTRLVGKKGILPAPDATQADWDTFLGVVVPEGDAKAQERLLRKLGRPDDPKGYEYKAPDGMAIPEATLDTVKAELHKAGLTKAQFAKAMEVWVAQAQQGGKALEDAHVQAVAATELALKADWKGAEYQAKLDQIEAVRTRYGMGDDAALVLRKDPGLARALADLARARSEDNIVVGGQLSPNAIDAELRAMEKHPAWDAYGTEHDRLMARKAELYRMKYAGR